MKTFAVLLSGIRFGFTAMFAVGSNGFVLGIAYLFCVRGGWAGEE